MLNQAANVASTPYQAYTGELTAGVNSQQQAGISGINAAAGQAQYGLSAAQQQANAATSPITAQQIQSYQNPYTQQVVNATEAQLKDQDQQQQAGVTGNLNNHGKDASFNDPSGVAVDSALNVYVADTTNNLIRKINAKGDVTT